MGATQVLPERGFYRVWPTRDTQNHTGVTLKPAPGLASTQDTCTHMHPCMFGVFLSNGLKWFDLISKNLMQTNSKQSLTQQMGFLISIQSKNY